MILTSKREVPWADEEPQTNPSPIVNGSVAEGYTYDAVGNRLTSAGPTSYNYNASNELTSTSAATYTYDSNVSGTRSASCGGGVGCSKVGG
jgi:hypothetical protein